MNSAGAVAHDLARRVRRAHGNRPAPLAVELIGRLAVARRRPRTPAASARPAAARTATASTPSARSRSAQPSAPVVVAGAAGQRDTGARARRDHATFATAPPKCGTKRSTSPPSSAPLARRSGRPVPRRDTGSRPEVALIGRDVILAGRAGLASTSTRSRSPERPSSTDSAVRRARPCCTCTAPRRAPTTGPRSWSARAAWRPTCSASGARARPGILDYTLPAYVDFVEEFLDALDADSVTLVGHGWGAAIGLAFAQRHPAAGRAAGDHRRRAAARTGSAGRRWFAAWRVPGIGELLMGSVNRWLLARTLRARVRVARRVARRADRRRLGAVRPGHPACDPAPAPLHRPIGAGRRRERAERAGAAGAGRLGRAATRGSTRRWPTPTPQRLPRARARAHPRAPGTGRGSISLGVDRARDSLRDRQLMATADLPLPAVARPRVSLDLLAAAGADARRRRLRGRVRDHLAAEPRPGRAPVPRAAVSPSRASGSGTTGGTRATTSSATACCSRPSRPR